MRGSRDIGELEKKHLKNIDKPLVEPIQIARAVPTFGRTRLQIGLIPPAECRCYALEAGSIHPKA